MPNLLIQNNNMASLAANQVTQNWGGSSMSGPTVVALLPDQAFSAVGRGIQSLTIEAARGPRVSGRQGSIDLQILTGTTIAGVAATGSIAVVGGASLVDGQTFTLNDGVNAATVFEFDSNASVTGGRVGVVFTGGDSAGTVRDAVIAAINGVGAGLAITASPGTAAQVLLTNDALGAAGNVTISDTVVDAGFVPSGMSGGVTVSSPRTVLFLTDNVTSPTKYIAVSLDATNRPFLKMTNIAGTVVAQTTPGGADIPAGQLLSIRVAWSSVAAVQGLRFASLRVNRELVTVWGTDPTAAWTYFQPTHVALGAALGAEADFNGTISALQLSDVVTV